MRHNGTVLRQTGAPESCVIPHIPLDGGPKSCRLIYEMNNTIIIANVLTTNSPLLNLSAVQTAIVLLLVGLGSFYLGRLTTRGVRRIFRAS